ncbi:nucleotidyl transferase AbiEii/AbiGii toxin family protein [Gracilinema caldarium]|uniref:Nucleotidyl transferase AbiEii/AbiGii toxin family protein n=1 Tax=Gracilinema caldarium (strain ATCC 51460 / DSM 7334 / H1) TaxID=744872 RepID=F8EZQ4_GRAC1|nr:nucleotidyl transferase AbiEii/AbiGii toxin family protein [Gracilinema caldarium]AEJ20778.1 Domain of unknown function DUF1814 [Gracilinema caldarium DSM 7334]
MKDRSAIQTLMERYNCQNNDDRRIALREIVQEISLLGLSRTSFFNHAAFYGGTALRIFYDLDRFSEDMGFSLIEPDENFKLESYLGAVRDELGAWGFDMQVEQKVQSTDKTIQSAFIKGGTLIHLIKIASITLPVSGVPENELIKIKIEIDTNPPADAGFEVKYRLQPLPFSVRLYDKASLFAGKLHALLCRGWKNRVKGRDFYDYLWYLSRNIPVNIRHLQRRMEQTGHWKSDDILTLEKLKQLLSERFTTIDFKQAREDVLPFVKDSRTLDLWSYEFFNTVTQDHLHVM